MVLLSVMSHAPGSLSSGVATIQESITNYHIFILAPPVIILGGLSVLQPEFNCTCGCIHSPEITWRSSALVVTRTLMMPISL